MRYLQRIVTLILTLSISVYVFGGSLTSISFLKDGEGVVLTSTARMPVKKQFWIKKSTSQAQLILDFEPTNLALIKKVITKNQGNLMSASVMRNANKTRLVLDMHHAQEYNLIYKNGKTILKFNVQVAKRVSGQDLIKEIKYKTLKVGETSEFIIDALNTKTKYTVVNKEKQLTVTFNNAKIASEWLNKMDVSSFKTPVNSIVGKNSGRNATFIFNLSEAVDYQVHRDDQMLTLQITKSEVEGKSDLAAEGYKGKQLSLNFQDISVRAVLQLLAEFTGINIVTSDAVQGNVTLHLNNVPWDQALDIILTAKGLGKRQTGNIIYIAPQNDIAAQEKLELEVNKTARALAPLEVEYIRINYADAINMAAAIKDEGASFVSDRGVVNVDERTNTLMIQDTATHIAKIKEFIHKLDIPVKQILIEARIVELDKNAVKELGVDINSLGNNGAVSYSSKTSNIFTGSSAATLGYQKITNAFNINLELKALETEGGGKIVSAPHLVVTDKQEAFISQGKEIPYQEASSSGATTVAFKPATLELRVTPQIAPNGNVILNIIVKKDAVAKNVTTAKDIPIIDKRELQTKLLIASGQTVVLGGIHEDDNRENTKRVPYLSKIPLLGLLFQSHSKIHEQKELLIFITPTIIPETKA